MLMVSWLKGVRIEVGAADPDPNGGWRIRGGRRAEGHLPDLPGPRGSRYIPGLSGGSRARSCSATRLQAVEDKDRCCRFLPGLSNQPTSLFHQRLLKGTGIGIKRSGPNPQAPPCLSPCGSH